MLMTNISFYLHFISGKCTLIHQVFDKRPEGQNLFLMEMGFRMDHEFVARGHLFRKGIMKIVVYKIFRILVPGNTDNTEALSLSYLVELSVVAPAGQDMVSDDMRNFAEQLKPLVHLEKIDPKRLM